MKNVDVVIRTNKGSVSYNVDMDDQLHLSAALEGLLEHKQLQPELSQLGVSDSITTLVVHTPGRLRGMLPPGHTLITEEGVSINRQLLSSVPFDLSVKDRIRLDRMFQNGAVVVSFLPEVVQ